MEKNQDESRTEQETFQNKVMDILRASMAQFKSKNAAMAEMLKGIAKTLEAEDQPEGPNNETSPETNPPSAEPDSLTEVLRHMGHAEPTNASTSADNWDPTRRYLMEIQPKSIQAIYDEWYGCGIFESKPVVGGLHALEEKYKSKWRKHFLNSNNLHLSRMKTIIKALNNTALAEDVTVEEVIDEWEHVFQTTNKKSLAKNGVNWRI